MTAEELQQRFVAEIEKRGRDDHYIDGVEERELLQIGLQHGYSTDRARTFLLSVCREKGYAIEAAVLARIREALRRHGANGLTRRSFHAVLDEIRPGLTGTSCGERELKKLVLAAIDDTATAIRKGWLTNWQGRLRREVGA